MSLIHKLPLNKNDQLDKGSGLFVADQQSLPFSQSEYATSHGSAGPRAEPAANRQYRHRHFGLVDPLLRSSLSDEGNGFTLTKNPILVINTTRFG